MYDWRGQFIEEDTPPEPTQPHCPDCGAFLSWQPTGLRPSLVWADMENIYDTHGDILDVIIHHEEWEDVEYWYCKKCGDTHSIEAVFPSN